MSKNVVAIIPARSGSKSIKDKRIINLLNKQLLAWSIEHFLMSKQILSILFQFYINLECKQCIYKI